MENPSFEYTYSAERRKEVEAIRKTYLPREEDPLEQLRKLHAIPTRKAQAASVFHGIAGTLIMGTGMSLVLTDIGAALGSFSMILGITVGLAGMVLVALAYPIYNRVLTKERSRIAPEVLRLTDELLK